MGYPKYDKEEAKRVYEESVRQYNEKQSKLHPADRLDDQVFSAVMAFIIMGAIIGVVGGIVGYLANKDKKPVQFRQEQVVVTKYKMENSKSSSFIVSYYRTSDKKHGEFETKTIYFAVGDTILANIQQ